MLEPSPIHLKWDADREALKNAKPEDFDGHTEFHRLTPEQRLAWLDQAVAFIQSAKPARLLAASAKQLP